jgi:MFS transporter, BCD family, chlorophyll transporter
LGRARCWRRWRSRCSTASFGAGLTLSILAYALIGLGVGASGTSLLALLARATAPRSGLRRDDHMADDDLRHRRDGGHVGGFLEPYSPALLLRIVAVVTLAFALTCSPSWGSSAASSCDPEPDPQPFREGLAEIWAERRARNFTLFVFLSMTAYFMQELILEPYAGLVFGFTPGQSTRCRARRTAACSLACSSWESRRRAFALAACGSWDDRGLPRVGCSAGMIALLGPMGPGAPLVPAVS